MIGDVAVVVVIDVMYVTWLCVCMCLRVCVSVVADTDVVAVNNANVVVADDVRDVITVNGVDDGDNNVVVRVDVIGVVVVICVVGDEM